MAKRMKHRPTNRTKQRAAKRPTAKLASKPKLKGKAAKGDAADDPVEDTDLDETEGGCDCPEGEECDCEEVEADGEDEPVAQSGGDEPKPAANRKRKNASGLDAKGRREAARYVAAFGRKRGALYFAQGKTFQEAGDCFARLQVRRTARLQAEVDRSRQLLRWMGVEEDEIAAPEADDPPASEQRPSRPITGLSRGAAKFAAGIKITKRSV